MTFTDDELRQLKIDLGLYSEDLVHRIWALLNRLEAAETALGSMVVNDDVQKGLVKKWRKACGK
jgi:hypothetical protein